MMKFISENINLNNYLFIAIVGTFALIISISYSLTNDVFAQQNLTDNVNTNTNTNTNNQPNINAENVFNTKTMTSGGNIKDLVILIPNEGHHAAGEDKESRFLDQHFVPENAIINTGTTVSWFNGDVGHERTIDVKDTDGRTSLFNTGKITDMQLSPTYTFDKSGVYNYEAQGDPGVTMSGTITVVDNLSAPVTSSDGSTAIDTIGILMVPTQDIDNYVQEIQNAGLTVDSRHDFKDLRGGQKGTGDVQSLIVWTSTGKDLNSIIPTISELSSSLPYS